MQSVTRRYTNLIDDDDDDDQRKKGSQKSRI